MRTFRKDPGDVGRDDQRKDRAGGEEVGFQVDCLGGWFTKPFRVPKAMSGWSTEETSLLRSGLCVSVVQSGLLSLPCRVFY